MSEEKSVPAGPIPVDIRLRQKARLLEIDFNDGSQFKLPCEYLRIFSPSAEVKAAVARGEIVHGKRDVNITGITPVGHYAIQLVFDDGHDTGVYSWKTLYELGQQQDGKWSTYLQQLEQTGLDRGEAGKGPRRITLLYFVSLPKELGKETEQQQLPDSVITVTDLVEWLKKRGDNWQQALSRYDLIITVNKQFAESDTPIDNGDEIAIVPKG
ncbi:MAG: gamma-butyrobetaine hydroxylase-like domain-containing protein [Gammaproteobacteria bacterium]|nr:gamma-butyrobetaine hydroxylase-like domain-containing protein [Gammaproteobacteria bacterium]